MIDEKEAVGQEAAIFVEDDEIVDAGGKEGGVKVDATTGAGDGLEGL